jgi:hypothetical protein
MKRPWIFLSLIAAAGICRLVSGEERIYKVERRESVREETKTATNRVYDFGYLPAHIQKSTTNFWGGPNAPAAVKQAALAKEAEVRTASEKEYLDKSFRVYTLEEVDKRLSDAAESAKTQDAAIKKDILDAINSVVAKRLSNTEQQQLKTVISEELTAKFNDQLVPKIRDSIRQSLLTDEDFLKEIAKRIPRE